MRKEDQTPKPGRETDDFLRRFDRISKNFENGQPPTQTSFERPIDDRPQRAAPIPPPLARRPGKKATADAFDGADFAEHEETPIMTSRRPASGKSGSKRASQKNRRYRLNVRRLLLTILAVVLLLSAALGAWGLSILATTPKIDATNIYALLPQNSVLYDANGDVLEKIYAAGDDTGLRTNLDYNQIPKNLINAFVAIEDKTFWKHHGFNIVRIFGAIWGGLRSGGDIKGTSTISQQLARNIYLVDEKSERTLTRKIREAYYAVQLENQLSKKQIIEAYMNTIGLGNGSYGVQAAAQSYFGKDAKDLTLAQCAVIASLAQAPSLFSPIRNADNEDIQNPGDLDFIHRGPTRSFWYNDRYRSRQELTLKFMLQQGKITQAEYDAALKEDIRTALKPDISKTADITSYYADYTVQRVIEDLKAKYNLSDADARKKVYEGGLRIYGTLDIGMQRIAEKEFTHNANFPRVVSLSKDSYGNVKDSRGRILLYKYSNMFADNGNFTVQPGEFQKNDDGTLTLLAGKRLNFYKTEVGGQVDYSVEAKPMYVVQDGVFYNIGGAYLTIPSKYKTRDKDGNLVLDANFIKDYPAHAPGEYGLVFAPNSYQMKARAIQPQAAMVVLDYHNGAVKVMVGGRNLEGKKLYNRALKPRQPGSSIKPMAVYGPALQRTADMAKNGNLGKYKAWTAATGIEDAAMKVGGKTWPKNWYSGYRGWMTLRKSVEQSVNVNAVKVWRDIGPDISTSFLKKLGVDTVVEKGTVNDLNPSLALGGMTNGVPPIEMAAGYGTFANLGVYVKPIPYSKVTNKKGEVILDGVSEKRAVMDRGVAFIMSDILRTTVTEGIAKAASIGGWPVAGKTGTTSDNYDAWFVGFSPYFSAALWIGNDINLELSQGSISAARLWSKIMRQLHKGLSAGHLPAKPDNVVRASIDGFSDYFISGTVPESTGIPMRLVPVCEESGLLPTPYCPTIVEKSFSTVPTEVCPLHTGPPIDTNPPTEPTPPTEPNPPGNGNGNGGGSNKPTEPAPPGLPT